MKLIIVMLLAIALAIPAVAADNRLIYDKATPIQGYACDPGKHLGTVSANAVLKVGTGGTYNIYGWLAVAIWTTAGGVLTLNGDSSKVIPLYADQPNIMLLNQRNLTQIVPSVGAIVCGM